MVIVIAQLAQAGTRDAFEGRVRDFIGEGSRLIEGAPIARGTTEEEVLGKLRHHLPYGTSPEVIVLQDPVLMGR